MTNWVYQPMFRSLFHTRSPWMILTCLVFFGFTQICSAQRVTQTVRTSDTLRFVQIIHANHMRQFTIDDSTQLQTLAGSAKIKEANTDLEGDSMVINKRLGTITIFGHVHFKDGQGMDTYSDYLFYNGTSRTTYLKGNVRISNGNVQLYGSDMEYNMQTGIGKYRNGGKVINGSTVLTSREADYDAATKDVLFRGNVHLRAPKYDMQSDSLRYNTQSRMARFIAPTRIKSESGTIQTNAGYYDMQSGEAVFIGYTTIQDKNRFIRGNRISFDDKNNRILVEGNGKFQDTENKVIVLGNQIDIDKKNETFLATRKPIMIFYDDTDSTYITADTLLSAKRLTTDDDTLLIPP
ncbi:MAG: OstA-like protein, partial [Ferruginibacter sp.]